MTRMQLSDGRRINYLDIGTGPAVVILHGWAMSSAIFSGVIDDLAQDFRLLIPDLCGHGSSDPGPDYRPSDFISDITAWFYLLGLERCNLIGWSFGGQLAMRLAADNLLPIERMVLVASTPKFCQSADWQHGLPEVQVRAMERQFRRDPASTRHEFGCLMFSDDEQPGRFIAEVTEKIVLPATAAGVRTLTTLRTTDLRKCLAKITLPTLVHHGQADRIIPFSAGEYIAGQSSATELVIWPEVGHAPFLSRPVESLSLWKEFIL